MEKKENKAFNSETEFHKKICSLLREHDFKVTENSHISFIVENTNDDVSIDFNFMSTGIHLKKNEIDKQEIIDSGFHYYPTWNWICD